MSPRRPAWPARPCTGTSPPGSSCCTPWPPSPSTRPPAGSPRPTWTPFPWPRELPGSRAWSPQVAASTPLSWARSGRVTTGPWSSRSRRGSRRCCAGASTTGRSAAIYPPTNFCFCSAACLRPQPAWPLSIKPASRKRRRSSPRCSCTARRARMPPQTTGPSCADTRRPPDSGAAYGFVAVGLVMFICMFDENDVLSGLNEQQRRAVTYQGGPLLVLAGAGTGKTRTLVARAAWLRGCQGMQASRILLLTFTRRAASDMLARAAAGWDASVYGSERICGGTFHAIAHKIIRQHAESFSLPPQFTILDPGDTVDILDALRPDHGLADPGLAGTGLAGTGQRAPRAAACADVYTRCVNTGRPVSEVVTASFPWCAPFTSQLAGLFRAYTARKRARHLLDFDDLLLLWQAALADPVAGPVLRGMFDAVLVDEYQDVNAVQASIVRLLQPDGKQLTCVGDDAQAIYGFRGASPAHLRQLTADYPGLEIVRLGRNYRSRQGVLDLANVIRPSAPGLDLTLTGDRGAGMAPVLVRAAHHSDILEIELSARKIPYVKFGGLRFTDTAHVKDFLAAARILANPADDLAWFRLLRLHEGIGPVHARRILAALAPAPDGPADGREQALEAAPARSRRALAATFG